MRCVFIVWNCAAFLYYNVLPLYNVLYAISCAALTVLHFTCHYKYNSSTYNSEDDFESPNSKRSPQLNLQSTFIPYDIQRRVRIRNSPINLKTFIDLLNVKQKALIKKIGFGSIFDCKITSLSTCMGYWLLSNYNPTTNTLNLGSHSIKITSKLVNQVLGIPCGSIQIKELSKPSKRDPIVAEVRSQIPGDIGLPEISHVKDY
ncbi:hypothetical protein R6Q57_021305 [Mikania cordata]